MSELTRTFEYGNLTELKLLVDKIRTLPDYHEKNIDDRGIYSSLDEIERLEESIRRVREVLRYQLMQLYVDITMTWTTQEIEDVTGYHITK